MMPICSVPSPTSSETASCYSTDEEYGQIKERSSTDLAALVRHKANLSISQTIKVFEVLKEELKDDRFNPPTRGALHKASKKICPEPFHSAEKNILRFDGKCFAKLYGQTRVEILAICLNDNLVALKAVKN